MYSAKMGHYDGSSAPFHGYYQDRWRVARSRAVTAGSAKTTVDLNALPHGIFTQSCYVSTASIWAPPPAAKARFPGRRRVRNDARHGTVIFTTEDLCSR